MGTVATLEELGYRFSNDGELRKIEDNSRFAFTNQEDYTRLGNAMTEELYGLLESRCGLRRLDVPVSVENDCGDISKYAGFVYASPDFQNKSTVVLLIHGSGAVRPGQWSRRLILNESLDVGSQFPYIRRAQKNGWGVIVCSTNTDEKFRDYPCRHLCAVYDQFLRDSQIQRIFVVAHSRGGPDFASAFFHFKNEDRIAVVCLTDSVDFEISQRSSSSQSVEGPIFINWKADSKLQQSAMSDENIRDVFSHVHEIYAGTMEHERSSHSAFNSVFHVLENWSDSSGFPRLLIEAASLISVNEAGDAKN